MATQHNTTLDTCGNGVYEHPDDTLHFNSSSYTVVPKVRARIIKERAVIRTLAQVLLDAGYSLRVYDGEDWVGPLTTSRDAIMADIMSVDEEHLEVYLGDGENEPKRYATVFLVYGNDGWDVVADYSSKLEVYMAPVDKLIEHLAAL